MILSFSITKGRADVLVNIRPIYSPIIPRKINCIEEKKNKPKIRGAIPSVNESQKMIFASPYIKEVKRLIIAKIIPKKIIIRSGIFELEQIPSIARS